MTKDSYGQSFDFKCDPPETNRQKSIRSHKWTDQKVQLIYDSLERVDFKAQDFELRIWQNCEGMCIGTDFVFVMRHYKKGNQWKAFYYEGYKDRKHKSIEQFFTNAELSNNKPADLKQLWEKLVSNNILTLTPPTTDELFKNGEGMSVSDDTRYTFELLKKDCSRRYSFSEGYSRAFPDNQKYKDFKAILRLMESKLVETQKTK